MKFLFLFFVSLYLCYGVSARCSMRGTCANVGGNDKPCVFDEEPPLLIQNLTEIEKQTTLETLEQICPHLMFDEDGNRKSEDEIYTCCAPSQVESMSESLVLARSILARCPSCFRNFARQICEMNCATDQARFLDVVSDTTADGVIYVRDIIYRMHERYMLDSHASCAGVLVPQTGLPAINLMCGSAPVCDAESWYNATGDNANNPLVPVQVYFYKSTDEADSMNAPTVPCYETIEGELPCSCIDCVQMCPAGTEPMTPEVCTVISFNCISFSVGLVFFIVCVIILTFFAFKEYKTTHKLPTNEIKATNNNNKIISTFEYCFGKIGAGVGGNPVIFIMFTSWIAFGMMLGITSLIITYQPLELWSDPSSKSRQDLNYFNSRFGPFYRTSQVFLQFNGLEPFEVNNVTYGPAFRIEALREIIELEDKIRLIGLDYGGPTLEEVCYAPLRGPDSDLNIDQCVIMSISTWLGDFRDDIKNNVSSIYSYSYLNNIQNCVNNYMALECLALWGGGAEPEIALGGYIDDNYLSANTLLVNYPLSNQLLRENLGPVLEWESVFLELLHEYVDSKPAFVDVNFAAERSIEDEIERVSRAEAVPILISYILMFIYVIIALGNVRSCKTWLVDSKISVAVSSIFVVLVSIACALGLIGFTGFSVTLLSINVIPFFILSVGVDNVFLMVNSIYEIQGRIKEFDDYNENFSLDKRTRYIISKMLADVGPSIFVTSITQITCFAIGTLANSPAVRTFSLFAVFSLCFLFIFQITTIVAILAVDYKRTSQNRIDILCCIRRKTVDDEDPLHSETYRPGTITKLMEPYSKFILDRRVKIAVVILFVAFVTVNVMVIPSIEVGLDQELALPKDSYVYGYLRAVSELLNMGPPVYFVLKSGLNFTDPVHQNVICGGQLCNEDSLTTQIFLASLYTDTTYIYRSSNSWLDDFFDWTSLYGSCCQYNTTAFAFCPSTSTNADCAFCEIGRDNFTGSIRPEPEAFGTYIPFFLKDTPTDQCNKAGLASYSTAVNYVLDSEGRAVVHDTNFMAYHKPLSVSYDYITALRYSYELSENITRSIREHTGLDIEVFPYSIFYVFYEQYLTTWVDTLSSVGYSLLGAFALNLIANGFNILTTFTVMLTALMVVVNMAGLMYFLSIPLNPISCVNLIVSIGIAVEFCSHIAYAYTTSKCAPAERVGDAIKKVGSTVITGITLTNLPIVVLAFSVTEIIQIFYFKMFLSIVLLGFMHGLVFFPVLLSYLNNFRSN